MRHIRATALHLRDFCTTVGRLLQCRCVPSTFTRTITGTRTTRLYGLGPPAHHTGRTRSVPRVHLDDSRPISGDLLLPWFLPCGAARSGSCDKVAAGPRGEPQPRRQGWLHPAGLGLPKRVVPGCGGAGGSRRGRHAAKTGAPWRKVQETKPRGFQRTTAELFCCYLFVTRLPPFELVSFALFSCLSESDFSWPQWLVRSTVFCLGAVLHRFRCC